MKCEICHRNDAEVMIQQISKNRVSEKKICINCAMRILGMNLNLSQNPLFSLLNQLKQLSNHNIPLEAIQVDKKNFSCPNCGTTYEEVEKSQVVGCPQCYETFKKFLDPFIYRNGFKVPYRGKYPLRLQLFINHRKKLHTLQSELKNFVLIEDFENAARVRDEIKKEKQKYKK